MVNTEQLIKYAQHPELALENLVELMALLENNDESIQNYSSEALENCGAPRFEDIPFLRKQLKSGQSTSVYWACTLIGRLDEDAIRNVREAIQTELCIPITDDSLELSAREKAAWAMGEFGPVTATNRDVLQKHVSKAPPRLKRLLESALALEQR